MDEKTEARSGRNTILAVGIAAAAGVVVETLLSVLRGPTPSAAYLALCAGLTLVAALLVAGTFALFLPRVAPALGTWIALNGFFALCDDGIARAAILGFGAGLLTWAALYPHRNRRRFAARSGLLVAVAIVFFVMVLPRLASLVGVRPDGLGWGIVSLAGVGGLLAAHSWYAAWSKRPLWMPSDGLLSVMLLVAVIATLAAKGRLSARPPSPLDMPSVSRDLSEERNPTIIVLILDTVRADHLSVYGYERDTTPFLRRFIEESNRVAVYPLAFSPASWTVPAHASLFSGQLPSTHGAHSLTKFQKEYPIIAERTLAEVLRGRGYRTAAILANSQLMGHPSLRRGFQVYVRLPTTRPLELLGEDIRWQLFRWALAEAIKPAPPASAINRHVLDFLESCDGVPCFVVANYMEAHAPYAPSRPHAGLFSREVGGLPEINSSWSSSDQANRMAESRYDEEIHALDAALGDLLQELQRRGTLDRAWLVITSDHGEAFGEHELFAHGTGVYNEEVRIPLLIQPPRGQRLEPRTDAVGLLDVTATLTSIAGEPPLGLGRDLRSAASERPVQIEFFGAPPELMNLPDHGPRSATPARAVVLGTTKLIQYPDGIELYRLANDAGERVDLSVEAPGEMARLVELLPPLRFTPLEADADTQPLSHEERERLRALGYIQ